MLALLALLALAAEPPSSADVPWWSDPAPDIVGGLAVEHVRAGLGAVSAKIRACMAAELLQRPDAAGPVAFTFTVQPDGVPTAITTSAPAFEDAWLLACAEGAVEQARFAEAPIGTDVRWVMQLGPTARPAIGGLTGAKGTQLGGQEQGQQGAWRPDGGTGTAEANGEPEVLGALDPSQITAVVERYMNQIRYCYRRELNKDDTLAGEVTTKFVIAKDGTVIRAEAKTSTLNNAAVEDCINGRIIRMQFPKPRGGGIVIVSYPFVFEPG